MNKCKATWHGKTYYYLGKAEDGDNYWLQEPTWDCDWYWGLGYLAVFTNNCASAPIKARDLQLHTHFDSIFLDRPEDPSLPRDAYSRFIEFFSECVLTKNEVWTLLELMTSCYTLRKAADMFHIGGAHFTTNPVAELKDIGMWEKINKELLPKIFLEITKLLSPEKN